MTPARVVYAVVIVLGLFVLAGLLGTIWLVHGKTPASEVAVVSGLCGTALGGLVGLLASTRSSPTETTIVNSADDPVPVNEAGQGNIATLAWFVLAVLLVLVLARFLGVA